MKIAYDDPITLIFLCPLLKPFNAVYSQEYSLFTSSTFSFSYYFPLQFKIFYQR